MFWLLVLLLLIVVFGLGTVLEAAFWTLVVVAAIVLLVGLAARGAMAG